MLLLIVAVFNLQLINKLNVIDNDITIALIMACYPYLFDKDI
jgi:hypothetical protein